ncbi:DNA replication and repair protein RecN [Natronincola peptidivorans]|uniref:DNA repair protein RecN n=1 Tax=Natronincola peptidivorans TaxID=426128 RepID=A0A1H9YPT5_9FIRM|nr:DNA repair protein RecN [Natronincola peptidivorans]SES70646.1 DNA replication and repair protein RecN [Natronincola peptidivorans]
MLLELEVRDFALIDRLNVNFDKGLNILTGETGAGKSIILDAINMAIGERADREFVRTGAKKSVIQAVFSMEDVIDFHQTLEKYGVNSEEEDVLIVTREIYANGRSISRVNGIIVNQSILKHITEKLIDIHGQHQHQSLLNTEFHIDALDAYGGNELIGLLNTLSKKYKNFLLLQNELQSFCYDEVERERKIDLLKFQMQEIDAAKLQIGEEEELNQQRNIIGNSEKIYATLGNIYETFYNSSFQPSVLDHIASSVKSLQSISNFDNDLGYFYATLEDIEYKIQDIVREINNYQEQVNFNPEVLEEIEKRLDTINNLKRKYGKTIEIILAYRDSVEEELNNYINSEEKISKLISTIEKTKEELLDLAIRISKLRCQAAKSFQNQVISILQSLNMKNVSFTVSITKQKDSNDEIKLSKKGIDKVEFMLSSNIGEPLKPLSKIASGGEMSRIMLALKTILAHVDNIPTLIFDEIDTGISGITAQTVAEKLYDISSNRQVICITHLPQIAAKADEHFLIEKHSTEKNTKTLIRKMDRKSRIYELGRLLGGEITDITLKHAEELINKANKKNKS